MKAAAARRPRRAGGHCRRRSTRAAVQTLFEQSGVIRVRIAGAAVRRRAAAGPPAAAGGRRVGIVGNSSALGVLAVDALHGRAWCWRRDPVDVGATVQPGGARRRGPRGPAPADDVDALVVVFVPPVAMPGTAHAEALREAVAGSGKPVVTTFLATEGMPASSRSSTASSRSSTATACPSAGRCPATPRQSGPSSALDARSRGTRAGARHRRARPSGHPGSTCRTARAIVDRHEGRARARARRRGAWPAGAATASKCCRSGGSGSADGGGRRRGRARFPGGDQGRPPSGGGTGSTARACG